MSSKTIIIESNLMKRGKLDRKPFSCQVITSDDKVVYVLDITKREVVHKHFLLTVGCRIIDDETTYTIKDIWYPPKPKYPHLIVSPIPDN